MTNSTTNTRTDLIFRPANGQDLPAILEIIDYARQRMLAEGKKQWNEAYPTETHISGDLREGNGYVVCDGGQVVAYGAIVFGEEPAYRDIRKGAWLTEQPYVVVHRLAVAGNARRQGLGTFFLQQVERLMQEKGVHSFKADTNFDNTAMLHTFEKLGFQYCGEIYYDKGARMAFEKVI